MPLMLMLVGLSGAGKSTIAEALAHHYPIDKILSSDKFREKLYGNAEDQSHNTEVFSAMREAAIECVRKKESFIYDATNLNSKRRRGFLKSMKLDSYQKVCFVIAPSIEVCIKNQKSRKRCVLPEKILEQAKQFQMPYILEGWDRIEVIKNDVTEEGYCEKIFKTFYDMWQENSHHELKLGAHMRWASELYIHNCDSYDGVINLALKYHDVGKPLARTYLKKNGEIDGQAHYYGHQGIGAYMLAASDLKGYSKEAIADAAVLVTYHMEGFLRDEKGYQKLMDQLGPYYSDALEELHKYDMAAH